MNGLRYLFLTIAVLMLATALWSFGLANQVQEVNNSAYELDEYIGDTVIVGMSALDNQHNIQISRTIAYNPYGNDGQGIASIVFTDLSFSGDTRQVKMNRVILDNGTLIVEAETGYGVSAGQRGGYATIGMCPSVEDPVAVIAFHDRNNQSSPWTARVAGELSILPGVFNSYDIPLPGDDIAVTQAKVAIDCNNIAHVVYCRTGDDEPREVYYARLQYDPLANSFTILNPGNIPQLVVEDAGASNADIVVSPDGQRVVIIKTIGRYELGVVEMDSSWDVDLAYWESNDGGESWNFGAENAINITQFQGPNPDALPDTITACVDTFRQDYECSAFLDTDNTLHVAFTVHRYFHYSALLVRDFVQSKIYYWNEEDQLYIQIASGDYLMSAIPPAYDGYVGNPSLYVDPETDNIYCLYQQYGEEGDTLEDGSARDVGETSGILNADLFMTASMPYYGIEPGYLWLNGINITDTRGTSGAIPAGDCRSERDASLAINNDGDYLHVAYLLDLDAGDTDNQTPEGTVTDNPIVYQRIPKQVLIDSFYTDQNFISNYPLHDDSTGFWEWTSSSPEHGSAIHPDEFELTDIYPNPFNSTARINFELDVQGTVSLSVFDILGREVATLLNRQMQPGHHEVSFEASDLASGVYFVVLQSGSAQHIQKMALIR